MARGILVASLAAPLAAGACHSSDQLPTAAPTKVTMVATGGFVSPTDAVSSPDGKTFYFAGWDTALAPALFSVASKPGATPVELASGDPLDAPIGLVMSCDGKTLYVADLGGSDTGSVLAADAASGALTDLGASNLVRPGGLAMGPDCKTLYVTGLTADTYTPALFSLPLTGGAAKVVWMGAPLVAPTGVHVDDEGVAWVMDHLAAGAAGEGVLFAIPSDGSAATEVVSNLRMGTPGGVSLTAGGGTAVMPTLDATGHAQLTSVHIATGEMEQLPTPDLIDPAGLRTARQAGVFAVVDSEGGAIYRAE
jgi:DNA-binding beta-propeller fold protein YncE